MKGVTLKAQGEFEQEHQSVTSDNILVCCSMLTRSSFLQENAKMMARYHGKITQKLPKLKARTLSKDLNPYQILGK